MKKLKIKILCRFFDHDFILHRRLNEDYIYYSCSRCGCRLPNNIKPYKSRYLKDFWLCSVGVVISAYLLIDTFIKNHNAYIKESYIVFVILTTYISGFFWGRLLASYSLSEKNRLLEGRVLFLESVLRKMERLRKIND